MRTRQAVLVVAGLTTAILLWIAVFRFHPQSEATPSERSIQKTTVSRKAQPSRQQSSALSAHLDRPAILEHDNTMPETISSILRAVKVEGLCESTEARIRNLASMGDSIVPALREALDAADNVHDRIVISRCLALIGSSQSVGILAQAIIDEADETAKDELARTLQLLDNPASAEAVIDTVLIATNDIRIYAALSEAAPRVLDTNAIFLVMAKYTSADLSSGQKGSLIEFLASAQSDLAVSALADIMWEEKDSKLRDGAALALGRIGGKDATYALVLALQEIEGTSITESVVASIENLKNKDGFGCLLETFVTTTNPVVKHGVAIALANAGEEGRRLGIEQYNAGDR